MFDHAPHANIVDLHPEYLSTKLGHTLAQAQNIPLLEVQHHHAHIAACLAENGWALGAPPVLGIVLDGAGMGDDGTIWGAEFLLADYCKYERLGTFKPVALPGGAKAVREPWRNLYAHLMAEIGWAEFAMNFSGLEVFDGLAARPREMLDAMIAKNINAPLASSCEDEALGYPFAIPKLRPSGLPYIEPLAMWQAILGDLILNTPIPLMAARFHKGLSSIIVKMAVKLAARNGYDGPRFNTIALSGGCFQNRILFEEVSRRLHAENFHVLSHSQVPANDGGMALGQAAIGAARFIAVPRHSSYDPE
jgi:hydrogenase maturation protein HypF